MVHAILAALLWVVLAASCPARGYWGDGPDRELAEVQKMKGVEVQINEVKGAGDLPIMYLEEGPRIRRTPVVEFRLKFLPKNEFLGQGPIKDAYERINRSGGAPFASASNLLAVVLCTRGKDGRTLAVTPLAIQYLSEPGEGMPRIIGVHFAISKDLLEHSLLRFVEMGGHAKQATDLYLGQKPKPGASRYWGESETDPMVKTPTEADQSPSPLHLIPGLPLPTGK